MDVFRLYDKSALEPILTRPVHYNIGDGDKVVLSELIRERTVKSDWYGDVLFITDCSAEHGRTSSVCYFFKGGFSLEKKNLGLMSSDEVIMLLNELFPDMGYPSITEISESTHVGNDHGFQISVYPPRTRRTFNVARPSVINDI